ncbi:MAG: DUF1902 domain-containing protein [Rhodospirillaceae bacterium]|nr:DUF1902 domain-containing protein [Rhodospirillaceae bacterium]
MAPGHRFYVKAEFDKEAKVWFVSSSDVPGLNVEAESPEELVTILKDLIPQLLIANGVLEGNDELPEVPYSLMLDSLNAGYAHH